MRFTIHPLKIVAVTLEFVSAIILETSFSQIDKLKDELENLDNTVKDKENTIEELKDVLNDLEKELEVGIPSLPNPLSPLLIPCPYPLCPIFAWLGVIRTGRPDLCFRGASIALYCNSY